MKPLGSGCGVDERLVVSFPETLHKQKWKKGPGGVKVYTTKC